MKIKEVIEMLLHNNTLEDEVIFTFFDKNYFLDSTHIHPQDLEQYWAEFVKQGQETLEGHLNFTDTGMKLITDLEELVPETNF
jgi:hypothetical protein